MEQGLNPFWPKGVPAEVRVPRVDIAIDCGAHVNPDRIRSQMEGAVIMGAGQAELLYQGAQGGSIRGRFQIKYQRGFDAVFLQQRQCLTGL